MWRGGDGGGGSEVNNYWTEDAGIIVRNWTPRDNFRQQGRMKNGDARKECQNMDQLCSNL